MEEFDSLFGLVVNTKNFSRSSSKVYGTRYYTRVYQVVGVMLISFKRMEFKQLSLSEFNSTKLAKSFSLDSPLRWSDATEVEIKSHTNKDGELVNEVKYGEDTLPSNRMIVLYDMKGRLYYNGGYDAVAYPVIKGIILAVDLKTHSFQYITENTNPLGTAKINYNYFYGVGNYTKKLRDMLITEQGYIECMGTVGITKDYDVLVLDSTCRYLNLMEYINIGKLICNRELVSIKVGNRFRARVDEWFISKDSSASIVGAILACYVLSLSESYINSLNTDGNDEFRRRGVVALINNYKYEELFYYLRKPENREFADSLLVYLKVTIY